MSTPWLCPKCRTEYPRGSPLQYTCFCGKLRDPPHDPWLAPHACDQVCGRELGSVCKHRCVLRCHPGRCPPCPQTVEASCHCGRKTTRRRCEQQRFSCGFPCSKALPCGHRCPDPCHPGLCSPCSRTSARPCRCGAQRSLDRPCAASEVSCGLICGKLASCGFHGCPLACHAPGECQGCPLERASPTCPCGKQRQPSRTCQDPPSTCGDSCGRLLSCGKHHCLDRCHKGPCVPCRQRTESRCECSASRKPMPCGERWECETRCKKTRNCGRHICRRRCCGGKCTPCPETCGERLTCRNHRCEAPCHPGPCIPCPSIVTLSCPCGRTTLSLPCGAERITKPPVCTLECPRSSYCHHPVSPHHCHKGICPTCRQVCAKPFGDCPHRCELLCHDPLPPLAIKTKKAINLKLYVPPPPCTPLPLESVRCPPCPQIVQRRCLGDHATFDRVCSTDPAFSCDVACNAQLLCSNHQCPLDCHLVSSSSSSIHCRQCKLPCQKPRPNFCRHKCPLPCHPGDCPRCEMIVQHRCYCLAKAIQEIPCFLLRDDPAQAQRLRSCGNLCTRLRDACAHECGLICHPGACASSSTCQQLVSVFCPCRNLSLQWSCPQVQDHRRQHHLSLNSVRFLECDDQCQAKKALAGSTVSTSSAFSPSSSTLSHHSSKQHQKAKHEGQQQTTKQQKQQQLKKTSWFQSIYHFKSWVRALLQPYQKQLALFYAVLVILGLILIMVFLSQIMRMK